MLVLKTNILGNFSSTFHWLWMFQEIINEGMEACCFSAEQLQYYYAFDPANGVLNEAQLLTIATTVWNKDKDYASLEALAKAIGSAASKFIAG